MGANEQFYRSQQYERKLIKPFVLYEENLPAFELFNELSSQRNYAGDGRCLKLIGLNYNGVLSYLNTFYGKKKSRKLFEQLMLIEKGMVTKTYEQN